MLKSASSAGSFRKWPWGVHDGYISIRVGEAVILHVCGYEGIKKTQSTRMHPKGMKGTPPSEGTLQLPCDKLIGFSRVPSILRA